MGEEGADFPDVAIGESVDGVVTAVCSEKLNLSSRVTPRFLAEGEGDTMECDRSISLCGNLARKSSSLVLPVGGHPGHIFSEACRDACQNLGVKRKKLESV